MLVLGPALLTRLILAAPTHLEESKIQPLDHFDDEHEVDFFEHFVDRMTWRMTWRMKTI